MSEEHERLANAAAGKPSSVKSDEQFVESWDELKEGLRYFIRLNPAKEVEVSKLKLLFRTHCGKELSETVFGYTAMAKLLSDDQIDKEFLLDTAEVPGKKKTSQNQSRLRCIFRKREDELANNILPKSVKKIRDKEKREAKEARQEEKVEEAKLAKAKLWSARPKNKTDHVHLKFAQPPGQVHPLPAGHTAVVRTAGPPTSVKQKAPPIGAKVLEPTSKSNSIPIKPDDNKTPLDKSQLVKDATKADALKPNEAQTKKESKVLPAAPAAFAPLFAALKNRKPSVVQGVPAPRKAELATR